MPDLKGHECKFLMVNALWVMKCRAMTCPEQFISFDHVHKKYICLYYTNDTNVSSSFSKIAWLENKKINFLPKRNKILSDILHSTFCNNEKSLKRKLFL